MTSAAPRRRKYVQTFVDRNGHTRRYYRLRGMKVALSGLPGTAEFEASYAAAALTISPTVRRPRLPSDPRRHYMPLAELLVEKARYRAKARGRCCTITAQWMMEQIETQKFRCALTGIRFKTAKLEGQAGTRNPYAPSLDRIDTSKGYEAGNVRIVLLAVNVALNEWGEELLREIASGLARTPSTLPAPDGGTT